MGDTLKPDLIDLMNPFTGWGLMVQKKERLERVGYLSRSPAIMKPYP
jgi:hypothetical protein